MSYTRGISSSLAEIVGGYRNITNRAKHKQNNEEEGICCIWFKGRVLCKKRCGGRRENKSAKNGLGKTD